MEVTVWDKTWLVGIGAFAMLMTIILLANSHTLHVQDFLSFEGLLEPEGATARATDSGDKPPTSTSQTIQSDQQEDPNSQTRNAEEKKLTTMRKQPSMQAVEKDNGMNSGRPVHTVRFASRQT